MGSVTLHSPSYSSVGQRYASISCTAVGWVYPSDSGTTTTGDSKMVLELLSLIVIQYGVGVLVMEELLVQKNQLIILLA